MTRAQRTYLFVASVTAIAVALGVLGQDFALPFPGWWAFGSFVVIAFVLETLNTQLRVQAKGSTSFIMHIAAALLFGGLWGGLVAGVSTLLGELARATSAIKIVFNVSQRIVSVVAATLVYTVLGGTTSPDVPVCGSQLSLRMSLQRDLGLFFVFAALYFLVNSALVNTVVVHQL